MIPSSPKPLPLASNNVASEQEDTEVAAVSGKWYFAKNL